MERKSLSERIKQLGFACLLLAIVLVSAFVSARFFQLLLIRGDSMRPAYRSLQLVLLDKRGGSYRIGDVIAFRCEGLSAVLVKRIAAAGGDTAQIVEGTLYVNGAPAPGYAEGAFTYAGLLEDTVSLPADAYIVIGDNVGESKDSRFEQVGLVHAEDVLGRIIPRDRSAG